MYIKRDIIEALKRWQAKPDRKPLIIQGARQIGKTWVMQEFGRTCFEYMAYFNFEASEELCREFEHIKNPERLIDTLRLYASVPIEAGRTLLVFDEIQQCNKALNSLKYFCEEAPQYHIMAAGSLLGVALASGSSFPVGKVEFMEMHPICFREFLRAEAPKMFAYLENLTEIAPLPEIVMGKVEEAYRRYSVCGGMPAAAAAMLENREVPEIENIQQGILTAYALDFAKHAPAKDIPRVTAVWKSIPSQLAKENRKFVYKLVKTGARAREYEDALLWLEQAGLILRSYCSSKPALPLTAYDDLSAFKIYLCDSGLLRVLAKLPPEVLLTDNPLYAEFKGAIAENAVLQSLVAQFDLKPRYWTSEGTAEIDFLLQAGLSVIPVEVKAGKSTAGKSLGLYLQRFKPEIALRYSKNNLNLRQSILDIPLFLADWTKPLLQLAKK